MQIETTKRYGECWQCDKMATIFKVGKEYICKNCLIEIKGKSRIYYKRKSYPQARIDK